MTGQAPYRRRLAAWTGAALAVALVAPVAGGAGPGTGRLRQENVRIEASRHSAVLALYALDSKLAQADAQLSALHGEAAELRERRASATRALRLARHDVRVAESRLAKRLRLLYEQGDVGPLEVLLGARSLDEALTGLENLDRVATQDKQVLGDVKHARRALVRLDRTIAERQARISRLEAAAGATAAALAQARSAKASYVGRLSTQQQLNEARISSLEAQARAAEARSRQLARQPVEAVVVVDTTTVSVDAGSRGPTVSPGARTLTVSATGYALAGTTATGIPVGWGVVAVDPALIPLGTKLSIPGYGEAVAADIGSAVRGPTIDLWFPTVGQAAAWGRRTVTITLH